MKKIYIVTLLSFMLASCGVDPVAGERALKAQGVTDVKISGWAWFGCAEDDSFRSNFTGTGSDGKPVSGTLCSGWFKGITVRYY